MVLTPLVIAKVVMIAALGFASWWRFLGPQRFQSKGLGNLLLLSIASMAWCAVSIWADQVPESNLLLGAMTALAVCAAATSALLISWQVSHRTLHPPRWVVAWLVAIPLVLALLVLLGVTSPTRTYRSGFVFITTSTYCVALVMWSLGLLARRLKDDDPLVRRSIPAFQVLILVIAYTELRDLNVACLFAGIAALGVLWASLRQSSWLAGQGDRHSILDQIGAFVFVFDRFGRLTTWNDPAATLIANSGRQPLRIGAPATEVIGLEVPLAGRHIVKFDSPDGVVSTVGYTTQPAANGSGDDRGWVVVLRRTADPDDAQAQAGRPALLQSDHRDETTGTLGRAALIERLRRTFMTRENVGVIRVDVVGALSEDADVAMREVAEGLDGIRPGLVIGRVERLAFAVLLPDATESSEMSARIRGHFDEFEDAHGASLAVTALVSSKDDDQEGFVRRVLTAPELIQRVKWQPRWY